MTSKIKTEAPRLAGLDAAEARLTKGGGTGNDTVQVNGANGAGDDFRVAPTDDDIFITEVDGELNAR